MARRGGLVSTLAQIQREADRARAAQLRAQAAAQRDAHRAHMAYLKAAAMEEKERQRLYVEDRAAEVAAMNDDLAARDEELDGLLAVTLDVDDYLDFDRLKQQPDLAPYQPGRAAQPEPAPQWQQFLPPEPAGMSKMFGKQKHAEAVAAARQRYESHVAARLLACPAC